MESTLFRVVDILNIHKISYWVTDGTLLGIVREDRILPWDSDIDIAVWKSEVSMLEVLEIFTKNGFQHIKILPDMDCLHLAIDNIQVDIGFFSEEGAEASIKWATRPSEKLDKLIVSFINTIFENSNINLAYDYKNFFLKSVVKHTLGLFSYLLTDKIKDRMYAYARNKYLYVGCTYPIDLLNFKKIKFKECEIVIPKDSCEYLRLCYGDNWRVPNKNYIWTKDTYNLKEFL